MKRRYEIQVEIENECFLNCKHCSSIEMRQKEKKELNYLELYEFLKLFTGPTYLYLTGGEPLLDTNIIQKIDEIYSLLPNINIGIYTCGVIRGDNGFVSISPDIAKSMKESGLKECYISLYHYKSKYHDYITNVEGSFDITKSSINNLLNVGINVKIHLVVNKYNISELHETIKGIMRLGVGEVRMLRIVKSGSAEINWADIGVPYNIQNEAIRRILKDKNSFEKYISVSGYPEIFQCRPFKEAIKCQSGINVLYVTNEGEVYPCACVKNNNEYTIGNIRDITKIKKYITKSYALGYYEECLNSIL